MKKLIYAIDVLDTNLAGTENQLLTMIDNIDRTKFDVRLLCLRNHEWLENNRDKVSCEIDIFHIQKFKSLKTYLNIINLFVYFRKSRPEIVHTFFPVSNIVVIIVAKLAGVRCVISSRRDYGEWMSASYLALTRVANLFVTKIISNSNPVNVLTKNKEKPNPDKLEVVFNGIDYGKYENLNLLEKPELLKKLPEGKPVIGIVANFRPMKKHETLIEAVDKLITKDGRDLYVCMVGGALSNYEKIRQMVRDKNLQNKILFAGKVENVKPYLAYMDICVNCSEMEGLSNAIMEYMAAGKASVVSDGGGNKDLITDGEHGYVFKLGDSEHLYSCLVDLLDNKEKAKKMGEAAKKRVKEQLSIENMSVKYELIYQNCGL